MKLTKSLTLLTLFFSFIHCSTGIIAYSMMNEYEEEGEVSENENGHSSASKKMKAETIPTFLDLARAIRDGDFDKVKNSLEEHPLLINLACPEDDFNKDEEDFVNEEVALSPGDTLLHLSILFDRPEITKYLLDIKPELGTQTNSQKRNPLHYATMMVNAYNDSANDWKRKDNNFQLLFNNNSALSLMQDVYGNTPLHLVVYFGSREVSHLVELMLDSEPHGLIIRNNQGQTPLLISIEQNHIYHSELIISKSQDSLKLFDKNGQNALHYLAHAFPVFTTSVFADDKEDAEFFENNEDFLKMLVEKAPYLLLQKDNKGDTPTHVALEAGLVRLAKFLTHADPNVLTYANNRGETPLDLAKRLSRMNYIEDLAKDGNADASFFLAKLYETDAQMRDNATSLMHYKNAQNLSHSEAIIKCKYSFHEHQGQGFKTVTLMAEPDIKSCEKLTQIYSDHIKEKVLQSNCSNLASSSQSHESEGEACSICLDPLNSGANLSIPQCQYLAYKESRSQDIKRVPHVFHQKCFNDHLKTKRFCPNCRKEQCDKNITDVYFEKDAKSGQ